MSTLPNIIKLAFTSLLVSTASCKSDLAVFGNQGKNSKDLKVERLSPIVTTDGEVIRVLGTGLTADLRLKVDGVEVPLDLQSSTVAQFTIPDTVANGKIAVDVTLGESQLGNFEVIKAAKETVLSSVSVSEVCKGVSFQQVDGTVVEGTSDCVVGATSPDGTPKAACTEDGQIDCLSSPNFPAIDKVNSLESQKKSFRANLRIAGVNGTITDCAEGEAGCYLGSFSVIAQPLKAVDTQEVVAGAIRSGITIAGVTGNVLPAPAVCSADGNVGCLSSSTFPFVDKLLVDPTKFHASLQIAGITGSLPDCTDSGSNCYVAPFLTLVQPFKAIDFATIQASNIKQLVTIAGITGNVPVTASDCAAEGATGCLAIANFPAVNVANATANQAKFHSSMTLGGVTGSLGNCQSVGALDCLTVSDYRAIYKAGLTSNQAKIVSTVTINGIGGTMAACAENASNCFIDTYAAATQSLKAVNYDLISATNIKAGSTLAGIAGTLVESPAACALDAATACVTSSSYPALGKVAAVAGLANIHNSVTAGGITGTMNDCAADGQTSCLAITNFPAVSKSGINSAKIHNSLTVGGVPGSFDDCLASGATSCLSTATFPSFGKAGFNAAAAKVRSTFTLAGVSGTLANCAAGDTGCFLPTFVNPTQPLKATDATNIVAAKIKLNVTIAGVVGSLSEAPSSCGADAADACVTISNFPAINKALVTASRLHTSVTAGGVTGTLATCAGSGATACVTDASYPAADKLNLASHTASFLPSFNLLGVTGTMGSCSDLGSDCYTAAFTATSQPLKAIDFSTILAANIKSGDTIGGVAGSLVAKPADCAADGSLGCVTVTDFPSVNKANVAANQGKFLASLNLGGVTGTLPTCAADAATSCFANSSYPSGSRVLINTNKAKFRSSLTLAGVAGTLSDCTDSGSNCYLGPYNSSTQKFVAIDYNSLTPGIIKSGTTISDVTGVYPNSSYPLTVADAYGDLLSSTFAAQIVQSTDFGWFNSNGQRLTHAGDTDLVSANLRVGKTIFGVAGTYAVPAAWDVRRNVSYDATHTGKLKTSCRSLTNTTLYNIGAPVLATGLNTRNYFTTNGTHTFTNDTAVRIGYGINGGVTTIGGFSTTTTYYIVNVNAAKTQFGLATTVGGTAQTITADGVSYAVFPWATGTGVFSTIDAYNNNDTAATSGNPWGNTDNVCLGVETTLNDDESTWQDMTGATPGLCNAPATECVYKDKITNLQFTKYIQSINATQALLVCDNLTYAGKSDWHLPSQYEMQLAHAHGLYSTASANWLTKTQLAGAGRFFWTSTKTYTNPNQMYTSEGQNAYANVSNFKDSNSIVCVRSDADL